MNLFALNLRFLVKMTGKPATLVSREMGVCMSTLYLYMNGVTLTKIEVLRRISDYFQIEIGKLLFSPLNDEIKEEFNKIISSN